MTRQARRNQRNGLLFVSPCVAGLCLFTFYPFFSALRELPAPRHRPVHTDTYARIVTSKLIRREIADTCQGRDLQDAGSVLVAHASYHSGPVRSLTHV